MFFQFSLRETNSNIWPANSNLPTWGKKIICSSNLQIWFGSHNASYAIDADILHPSEFSLRTPLRKSISVCVVIPSLACELSTGQLMPFLSSIVSPLRPPVGLGIGCSYTALPYLTLSQPPADTDWHCHMLSSYRWSVVAVGLWVIHPRHRALPALSKACAGPLGRRAEPGYAHIYSCHEGVLHKGPIFQNDLKDFSVTCKLCPHIIKTQPDFCSKLEVFSSKETGKNLDIDSWDCTYGG